MSVSLYSPVHLRSELDARSLRMQKKFGQNFLVSERVAERIAEEARAGIGSDAVCLEIGPGAGALTQKLAERFSEVCAIEIDRGIFPWLTENMLPFPNVHLYNDDALRADFAEILAPFSGKPLCACANLPYAVTSPLLLRLIESPLPFTALTLMVQKEAALRFCAKPGEEAYGSLSAYLAYYGTVRRLFDVKEANFYPRPNVTSCVVRLEKYEKKPFIPKDEALFFATIRAAFSARRKTILNCLCAFQDTDKETLAALLQSHGIDPLRRGETLSLTELCTLADALFTIQK